MGNLRGGVISITFFPPRPRFSPIGQRKVQKSDFRCLPGALNRGINIFFPFFQVFTDFVDEYKVRSAMKLFFSRNSCLIYSAISNEWFGKQFFLPYAGLWAAYRMQNVFFSYLMKLTTCKLLLSLKWWKPHYNVFFSFKIIVILKNYLFLNQFWRQ